MFWINFISGQRKFSLEITGEETLIDIENILNESYGINKDLYFYVDNKFLTHDSYFTPLEEILDLNRPGIIEIIIKSINNTFEQGSPSKTKQDSSISIGSNESKIFTRKIHIKAKKDSNLSTSQPYSNSNSQSQQEKKPIKVRLPNAGQNSPSPRNQFAPSTSTDNSNGTETQSNHPKPKIKLPTASPKDISPRNQPSQSNKNDTIIAHKVQKPGSDSKTSSPRNQNLHSNQNESQQITDNSIAQVPNEEAHQTIVLPKQSSKVIVKPKLGKT